MYKALITIFCVFLASSLFSQSSIQKKFTHFNEKDGLPAAEVTRLLIDRFGYVWLGTINGLARYDGYSFKRFYNDPNDSTSIKGLVSWAMFEDRKGVVWISSEPGFLNRFDPATQSFRQYAFRHLIKRIDSRAVDPQIITIAQNGNGRLYFGVSSRFGIDIQSTILYLDEVDDEIKLLDESVNMYNVLDATTDPQGNVWLISYDGLLKIDAVNRLTKIHNTPPLVQNELPSNLRFDSSGQLWGITNRGRLMEFNPATETFQIYAPIGILQGTSFNNTITFDPNGDIVMGTSVGVHLFDCKRKTLHHLDEEMYGSLGQEMIYSAAFDSFGTLWIGTAFNGLFKSEERHVFQSFSHQARNNSSLLPGWVNVIREAPDGKLWITSAGNGGESGISILDLAANQIRTYPFHKLIEGLNFVRGMIEISPGIFLAATNLGYLQIDQKNSKVEHSEMELPTSDPANYFLFDARNNFWICTDSGVYKRKNYSSTYKKYDLRMFGGEGTSNQVTMAIEGKYGLWLLTNDGLFLYDYERDLIERRGYDKTKGDVFISQDINSLYEDTQGRVWVGTWQGGLSLYELESSQIKTYTVNDGLPSMSIQSILADDEGQSLWVSTFEGLSRFDLGTQQFFNYSVADGIQGQLFADGSFLKTRSGLFVFGGSNGITAFDPKQISKNVSPPRVFLTDLKLFNKSVTVGNESSLKAPIYETREVEFNHDQNNISIEFIALHYSNPSKNRYAYRLENYDADWRELSGYHSADYPNLPPGDYTFHVKAANSNGLWNNEGAILHIIVHKPWWKTYWAYAFYGALALVVIYAADRYLRGRVVRIEREKARTRELEQAREIERAYTELKSAQSQLIQSEKMASLGELTAGIAHEIQNPLNFVNNFSEVNVELIDDLKEEIAAGNKQSAEQLADNIKSNEEKINQHGKRADGIVKSMLQHSRSSTGQKELTDINNLCDEYLRLAYHGFRAKDKSFNAEYATHFDPSHPKISIVPQDIGRVLLNLINNAFYAVNDRAKQKEPSTGFRPLVEVIAKSHSDKIEIRVKDNGNGIPDSIKEKIFQPFFTTKPTGQGTGLGLSLAYDIITKAHGGELKVETTEGAGSEFIILFPLSKNT